MGSNSDATGNRSDEATPKDASRPVGSIAIDLLDGGVRREIDLIELWSVIWNGRILIIAITGLFVVAGLVYSLLATKQYRADVSLMPAHEMSIPGIGAQLGGLATLAGISLGGGDVSEPIAVLKSREFTRRFIEENQLIDVLSDRKWDSWIRTWLLQDSEEGADWRDAVKVFDENVRDVREDLKTHIVTLSIEWSDPDVASKWANELVDRLNKKMRERALAEARSKIAYLQEELDSTAVVSLQQSIGRLLDAELQKLMLAKGSEDFAFRIVDRAEPPKFPSKPKTLLVILFAIMLGSIVSIMAVVLRHAYRGRASVRVDNERPLRVARPS